jgi:hypothetical protein
LRSLCIELGNAELLELIYRTDGEEMTLDHAIALILLGEEMGTPSDLSLDFAAAHFHELSALDRIKLSCSALTQILFQPSLKLKSEDDLLEFLMDESADFASLLEFVNFEFVTADGMTKCCQFLSEHFEFMTVGLWERLRVRLCSSVAIKSSNPRVPHQAVDRWTAIAFETGSPLNGIIAYLTTKCGSNIHDANVVTVTANSVRSNDSHDAVRNVVASGTANWFFSRNEPNQWICCDFRGARIRLTHYLTASNRCCPAPVRLVQTGTILTIGFLKGRWMERSGLPSIGKKVAADSTARRRLRSFRLERTLKFEW